MKTTLEEQFPDKNKMYLSPSKESIMVYVEGKWQMFFREDKVTEIKDAAVNAKLQEAEKYKQDLIEKTISMEKTADKLFGENDYKNGNNNALINFRIHIKELFPFK